MTEHEYHTACAAEANRLRRNALAINDILTETQAMTLRLAMDAMPEAAVYFAETAFEEYGWPADDLDTTFLDAAGRATWEVFCAWRRS